MITKAELEKLKELAKAATPGPWVVWRPYITFAINTVYGVIPKKNLDPKEPYLVETEHNHGTKSYSLEVAVPSGANPSHEESHAAKNMEHIAAANPETVLRLIEALEVATEAIKEIEAKKDKTRLHECCVNNTCMEVYKGSHKVANCAFQYGVNQGYLDSADLAQEALNKIYG